MGSDTYPLCGAKARHGGPCRQPAMANGRCYYHGGPSLSGTAHGRYIHGHYTKEVKTFRRQLAALMRESKQTLVEINETAE